ncbi:hypothetical protein [Desulfopila sp. IMCC35008]
MGNFGGQATEPMPMHGRSRSLTLVLPPIATIMLEVES